MLPIFPIAPKMILLLYAASNEHADLRAVPSTSHFDAVLKSLKIFACKGISHLPSECSHEFI